MYTSDAQYDESADANDTHLCIARRVRLHKFYSDRWPLLLTPIYVAFVRFLLIENAFHVFPSVMVSEDRWLEGRLLHSSLINLY